MILVRKIEGRFTPLAVCDTCAEPVAEPGMAAVVFDMRSEDADLTPWVAHKGRCHDQADARIRAGGGWPGWNEFSRWMADLLHNSGLRDEELAAAIERSEFWSEFKL